MKHTTGMRVRFRVRSARAASRPPAAILCGIFLLGCLNGLAVERGAGPELEICVGGSRVVDIGVPVHRAEVGRAGIVQVVRTERPGEVLLKGEAPGATDVRLYTQDGRDSVYRAVVVEDVHKVQASLTRLLDGIPGIEIEGLGSRVVVRGRLLKPSDMAQVEKVAGIFGPQVISLAVLDSAPFNGSLAREIRDRIREQTGAGGVRAEIVNEKVQLSGTVYDKLQRAQAQEIAAQYDRPVLNLLDISEGTVEIDVLFAKYSTSRDKNIGANILNGIGLAAQGTVTGGKDINPDYSWSATASADLTSVLRSFASHGEIRQIARPHLSARSGKDGTFHSGGVMYLAVSGSEVADLKEIAYGLFLKVTPEIRADNEVSCDIDVSIRAPVDGGGGGVVSLNVAEHRIETSLRCRLNETMILSGVISSMGGESLDGFPILRRVPILSYFFSRRRGSDVHEELVILMTPHSIKSRAATHGPTSEETIKALGKAGK